MPLPSDAQLISVDDHVIEHAKVWQDRLPAKFAEQGPRVVEQDGNEVWLLDGEVHMNIGLNAVAGKPAEEFGVDPVRFSDMIPGCYDPKERVKDMDIDGIQAQLCFPTFPGFAGTKFSKLKDRDLALACVQAYNDWQIDEWCGHAPDRLIPLTLVPFWDPAASAIEAQRVAAKGAKSITFPENPVNLGCPSFHSDAWDPFFAVVEETGMPLSMHFGTGGAPATSPDAPFAVAIALYGTNSQFTLTELLFSPVFRKFPNLKVALSEGGIGWIPYILERCDYTWGRHRHYQNLELKVPPSEMFRGHVFGCFISDEGGLAALDRIGVDSVMWECDYPHSDSNWPHSRKLLEESLRHLPDEDASKIAEWNARKLYSFTGGRS
jgi:predicted TIM-barrel fold metal-dependent hydrolase